MANVTLLHFTLKTFFSGLIVYAVIQFLYLYYKVRKRETLAPVIISSIALLYILSDTLALFFSIFIQHKKCYLAFSLIREAVSLLFFLLAPYYLNRIFSLKKTIKKINYGLLLAGIAAALSIITAAVIFPKLLLSGMPVSPDSFNTDVYIRDNGPLIIIKNIILIIYLLYSVFIILNPAVRKKTDFPIKTIFIGLIIISYFAFYYIYTLLFTSQEINPGKSSFPYLGSIIGIFIIFMTFGLIELFINYYNRTGTILNNLRSELYYDLELGVPNRISFRKDLNFNLNECQENNDCFTVIVFDIDDFQNINESYGERFGDEILKSLSHRLIDNFAQEGVLYRIGGDEFSFILNDINTKGEAGSLASKIISSLKNPFVITGMSYMLTVSIAILFIPQDGNDIDSVIDNAYGTLRIAKKVKNTYEFFSSDLLQGTINTIYTVDLLRNCIAKDEFTLHYQPVVDTDEKLVYAEALLRCDNKNPAIGGPQCFIPIIEKAGLTKDLDNLVVRKAFYDMEMKIKNKFAISINLTANQLADPAYGEFLSSFAKQHGIETNLLVLEITESTLVENISLARESLSELKKYGFPIAIDDFGKGFSSLTYLAELPVDILKIDMAFVHAVPGDPKKEILVKYIIELGNSLNLKVVAEGFETPEQVNFFKKNGCKFYQGYYFSKPMPLQDLLKEYS